MSKAEAMAQATTHALACLEGVQATERLASLGFPAPSGGIASFRLFARDVLLDVRSWDLRHAADGSPVRPADRVLLLHFLACPLPVRATGEAIGFRDFPGGQFYEGPFRSRTVRPLAERYGNRTDLLRAALDRFDWEPVPLGDLGARIHAFGPLSMTLLYTLGDAEFAPAAEVVFDACTRRCFGAEDASVLASRICLGLL